MMDRWIRTLDSATWHATYNAEEYSSKRCGMSSNSNFVDDQGDLRDYFEVAEDSQKATICLIRTDFTPTIMPTDLNEYNLSRIVQDALCKIPHDIDDDYDVAAVASDMQELLITHGNKALEQIRRIVTGRTLSTDATALVLRLLGEASESESHNSRRKFIEDVLLSARSPVIKDAANVGLASMDDPKAIRSLRTAISSEKSLLLKKLLRQTLNQLETTKSELHT